VLAVAGRVLAPPEPSQKVRASPEPAVGMDGEPKSMDFNIFQVIVRNRAAHSTTR